jgi:hypothetical protein
VQALGVATETVGAKRCLDTASAGGVSGDTATAFGANPNERSAEQMLRFGRVVGALVGRVRAREARRQQLEPG